jgi:hypothetical protein
VTSGPVKMVSSPLPVVSERVLVAAGPASLREARLSQRARFDVDGRYAELKGARGSRIMSA